MNFDAFRNSIRGLPKNEAVEKLEQLYIKKSKELLELEKLPKEMQVNEEKKEAYECFTSAFFNSAKIPKEYFTSKKIPCSNFYEITENIMYNINNKLHSFYDGNWNCISAVKIGENGAVIVKAAESEIKKADVEDLQKIVRTYFGKETFTDDDAIRLEDFEKQRVKDIEKEIKHLCEDKKAEVLKIEELLNYTKQNHDSTCLLADLAVIPEEVSIKELSKKKKVFEFYDLGDIIKLKNEKKRVNYLRNKNMHMLILSDEDGYSLHAIYGVKFNSLGEAVEGYDDLDSHANINPEDIRRIKEGIVLFLNKSVKEYEKRVLSKDIESGRQKTLIINK
ncbi:Uncharacterised protein [Candidatus Tiddalikarchaeum anstoanum]|nr:Uncharacterised protein [Candidatus Tiddalikarchaeum anstoanum]